MKYAIDNIFPNKNLQLLNLLALVFLALALINTSSNFLNGLLLFLFRTKVTQNIQKKLFNHMEYLNMTFHNNQKVGQLVSRLMSDSSNIQGLLADTQLSFIRNVLSFFIGVSILFFLHWKLALMAISILPLFAYSLYFFSGRIRAKSTKLQQKIASVFEIFFETLYSIPLIKSFLLEEKQGEKARDKLENYFNSSLDLTKTSLLSGSITAFVGAMGPLLILWIGGREIIRGNLTLGGFIAFNGYLGYLYGPVQSLMGLNTTVQNSLASLKRVFEIFDIPREDSNKKQLIYLRSEIEKIKYENVTFSYDGSKPAIKNISLTISAGEKIALIGQSGAGKTTLIHLLLKFYTTQAGGIYINDIKIQDIKFDDLRLRIGIFQQNPLIFSGTIKDNIKIGNLKATEEEIVNAGRIVDLYDFIVSLPNGFDTEVGERGVKLSGGQRQKLAIARVILKNPEILILDEATSEIDLDSERRIFEEVKKIINDKTAIFITHRLSNIINTERIVFMENGSIKGTGNHRQLYATIPSYRKLCDEQSGGAYY